MGLGIIVTMLVQLHMLVDIGLGLLYFGCFLYVVMRYTFKSNSEFVCDSCTVVFGTSSGLRALLVVGCLAVGWMFWFPRCFKRLCWVSLGCV